MAKLDQRRQAIKDAFIENRGYWAEVWDDLLRLSPDYFEAYMEFSSLPWTSGVLAPKVKEFIYIAIDASTTHLYKPGLRIHIRNALRHGASVAEISEVLQLTSALGVHSCTMGVPILVEALERAGKAPPKTLDARQAELKRRFVETRGYWTDFWDDLLRLSPDFLEAYLKLSGVPWSTGSLEPKVKEFIYVAIDAATTHLYEPGLRLHIDNAIRHGASAEELMEVLELASVLGVHTMSEGVPMLMQEARKAGQAV